MQLLIVFLCGVLFALGLGVAGMTQPAKIIAFLDFGGAWDPSLMFVMGGAVGVNMVLYRLTQRRPRPVFDPAFTVPSRRPINVRLITGAGLFGAGWGLGGYCPGPAWVSSVSALPSVLAFLGAMLAGMLLFQRLQTEEPRPAPEGPAESGGGAAEKSCG